MQREVDTLETGNVVNVPGSEAESHVPNLGRHVPTVATETLEPGDEVLFFTDGAIEVRDTERRELGRDGLADLFYQQHSDDSPPEQTVRHLARAVLEHRQDVLADDSSFVLLRWNGRT